MEVAQRGVVGEAGAGGWALRRPAISGERVWVLTMNFKLSPFQYHRLNPRARMAAGLSGFSGFASAVEVKHPAVRAGQLVPSGNYKSLAISTLQAPTVGSGLTRGYRAALTPSGDQLNWGDHSLENLPRYTKLPGSNIRPGWPNVARFAGLGVIGPTDVDPVEQAEKKAATMAAQTATREATMARSIAQNEAASKAAASVMDEATYKDPNMSPAERKRLEQLAAQEAAKQRAIQKAAEAQAALEREAAMTINPDAIAPIDQMDLPATALPTAPRSNTLLYVGAAALGLGVLYFVTRK